MQIIRHRINTINDLNAVDVDEGVELDVRYQSNDLILQHDPFFKSEQSPTKLSTFLQSWVNKGPIILNLKSEGIEEKCISLLKKFQISDWFFLDMSMPFLVKFSLITSNQSIDSLHPCNLAVRFSDFEPIEYALSFKNRVGWVWVDSFKEFPLSSSAYSKLKDNNFKLCLVSPELHGQPAERIEEYKTKIRGMSVDAVCTKYPFLWK